MRVGREVRRAWRARFLRRGYPAMPLRPGPGSPSRSEPRPSAGGIIVGPPGIRRMTLDLIRTELGAGRYVTDWRLATAMARLLTFACSGSRPTRRPCP